MALAPEHDFRACNKSCATAAHPAIPSSPMPTMDSQRSGAAFSRKAGSANAMQRVLILGGTGEARELARTPRGPRRFRGDAVARRPHRRAGAAGRPGPGRRLRRQQGARQYLAAERIDVLIDATHPFAARSRTARPARPQLIGVRLLALRRPPWVAVEGDRWTESLTRSDAVSALGPGASPCLSRARPSGARAFRPAPQHHYLMRSVDPVSPPLAVPHATYMTARGPFTEADDRALLERHGIDVSSPKNSGGTATYGKIAAARALGIEVVMIAPAALPECPRSTPSTALWRGSITLTPRCRARRIDQRRPSAAARSPGSPRYPTMTQVAMSAIAARPRASVVMPMRSSSRPTARPKITAVSPAASRAGPRTPARVATAAPG